MQEQTGMYGAIVINPRDGETIKADRDHVMLLSDWSDGDPMRVFAKLTAQCDYYNVNQPTVLDFFRDASRRVRARKPRWPSARCGTRCA